MEGIRVIVYLFLISFRFFLYILYFYSFPSLFSFLRSNISCFIFLLYFILFCYFSFFFSSLFSLSRVESENIEWTTKMNYCQSDMHVLKRREERNRQRSWRNLLFFLLFCVREEKETREMECKRQQQSNWFKNFFSLFSFHLSRFVVFFSLQFICEILSIFSISFNWKFMFSAFFLC